MSTHEDFHRESGRKELSDRSFGFLFAVILAALALVPLLHRRPAHPWLLAAGAALAVAALLRPSTLHLPNRLWSGFGLLMGRIMNPLIMAALYYVVMTPAGLILRLLGKDLLSLRADPGRESYWIERRPPGPAPESMSHQF